MPKSVAGVQVLQLKLHKLYGTLSMDVSFKRPLSLLVGINGSGKTSVLNVIDWLLRPDIPRLATTPFERLTLHFLLNGRRMIAEVISTKTGFDFFLKKHGQRIAPFNVKYVKHPSTISGESELESLTAYYRNLRPEKREQRIWRALAELPKPTVITLERTLTAEVDNLKFIEREDRLLLEPNFRPTSPLVPVLTVTSSRYAQYRNKMAQLNEVLKGRIVLSALRYPPDPFIELSSKSRLSARDLERLENKVREFVSTAIEGSDVAKQTGAFFRRIRALTGQSKTETRRERQFIRAMYSGQLRQVEDLASAFNDFETKATAAFEGLNTYLSAINGFLQDSGKRVEFNPTSGRLGFRLLDGDGLPSGDFREVFHLSSGERQILVLLTFLAFLNDQRGLFIVDEPELSLHPKWQAEFVGAFLTLKPAGTQLLMATHSPDIVGPHKRFCVVLRP